MGEFILLVDCRPEASGNVGDIDVNGVSPVEHYSEWLVDESGGVLCGDGGLELEAV